MERPHTANVPSDGLLSVTLSQAINPVVLRADTALFVEGCSSLSGVVLSAPLLRFFESEQCKIANSRGVVLACSGNLNDLARDHLGNGIITSSQPETLKDVVVSNFHGRDGGGVESTLPKIRCK
jgi:hypothetical protein